MVEGKILVETGSRGFYHYIACPVPSQSNDMKGRHGRPRRQSPDDIIIITPWCPCLQNDLTCRCSMYWLRWRSNLSIWPPPRNNAVVDGAVKVERPDVQRRQPWHVGSPFSQWWLRMAAASVHWRRCGERWSWWFGQPQGMRQTAVFWVSQWSRRNHTSSLFN